MGFEEMIFVCKVPNLIIQYSLLYLGLTYRKVVKIDAKCGVRVTPEKSAGGGTVRLVNTVISMEK